jgi:RNA polymerase sigma-70 factor (ECF subfamily)
MIVGRSPYLGEAASPDTLDALVERARDGDSMAFDQLVLCLHRNVAMTIAAHAISADQVEEVVQETWVIAYEQLGRYELRGTFLPWVKGIARNVLREHLRECRRVWHAGDGDLFDRLLGEAVDRDLADEARAEQGERRLARLSECLEALTPRARAVLVARDRDGEELGSLARRFKQPKEALATALWRIRLAVRHCLETAP